VLPALANAAVAPVLLMLVLARDEGRAGSAAASPTASK
jgi:hypothetical protein